MSEISDEDALKYLAENHPHVHKYATVYSLRRAMVRLGTRQESDRSTTIRRLDQFAAAYREDKMTAKPKKGIKVGVSKIRREANSGRWKNVDEMIRHFQGTGQALEVPRGVTSLEEMED